MSTFVVFGGSKGIGGVLTDRLLKVGDRVIVVARSCEKNHENLKFIQADLSEESQCKKACEQILGLGVALDGLVFAQRYRGDSSQVWEGEVRASLLAFRLGVEELGDAIVQGGAIVAISSNAARLVTLGQPVGYHMAKAGLESMVRYYALALGARQIKVNAVAPATTIKPENEEFYRLNPELVELYERAIPLRRMCRAEYVCEAVEFLLSATHITGQILDVDGGLGLLMQDSLVKQMGPMDDSVWRHC